MKKSFILSSVLLLLAAVSCKKDKEQDPHDHDHEPVITILEPTKDHFHPGDNLHIHIKVEDEQEMHEAEAWLIALPQNDTLWKADKHAHSKIIELEGDYTFGDFGKEEQEIQLVVRAENAAGKTATKTFKMEVADHGHGHEDHEPVITIHQPTKDHFHPGDKLDIHIDVVDEKEMHKADFWLIALPNDTLLKGHQDVHDVKTITFRENYTFGTFEDHHQKVNLVVQGENAAGKTATKTFELEVVEH